MHVYDINRYICKFTILKALPQFGILSRSITGLLIYEGEKDIISSTSCQLGSRLKTPALPIWVTNCNGHYGVLFNSNRELLRNYHAEKRFELYYYTCAGCSVSMVVDNRSQDVTMDPGTSSGNLTSNLMRDDMTASPLERLIHTKWPESRITIKGPIPAAMAY